ncbi:Cdc6/Cdc18 family protein [Halohasta salina]|uniref:Cdc6/Cdc18 family protein n=1 Tax=Halohasta salina TaxID=2961621 RepID=UPI0020A4E2CE|nr:Cdc6/Cdc18 family protein [Halohasta salina]
MIEDARVLRDDFIPAEVVHRDPEIQHISRVLSPLTEGQPAETLIVTGPSGAGKTCLTQFAVDRLKQEVLDLHIHYINCWQNYSRFRVLYRILEGLGKTVDIHRQSTPHDELIERLQTYSDSHSVVILDEADQLQDTAILYDLHQLPHISMILIANREAELLARVDERLSSRLVGSERLEFSRYSDDELVAILRKRAEAGLVSGAIRTQELETIAEASAGDARAAISILRNAARTAQFEQAERITSSIVSDSIPDARQEIHQKNLDRLTPDQRVVYEIIEEAGEITPSQLYQQYSTEVDDPKTDRTVRNYLSKMTRYNLIAAEGTSHDRRYKLA